MERSQIRVKHASVARLVAGSEASEQKKRARARPPEL